MPVFSYRGRGASGLTTGEVEAPDRMAAVGELRSRAILVTKIEEKAGGKTVVKQVGEAGGILDVVLQRLSVYIEKAAALKRKVKAAMVYPSTIIGVAFLIVIFMLTFVIPTFATMFKNLGADLPLPTQIVLWMSDFVRGYIIFIILGAMGAVYLLRRYYKTENGKSTIDALLLKLPVFGTLIRKVAVGRFTRTL